MFAKELAHSTVATKMLRTGCVFVCLTVITATAWAENDSQNTINDDQDTINDSQNAILTLPTDLPEAETVSLERIEALLEAKEFGSAIEMASQAIMDILRKTHQYDEQLVDPLILLGDGFHALNEYPLALDSYLRARQITRISKGLHALDQVQVLDREASTLFAMNRVHEANELQERAFAVHLEHYGMESPKILPGMQTLASWYLQTGNIFAARSIFRSCATLSEEMAGTGSRPMIDCLKGLAQTYRLERWGSTLSLARVVYRKPSMRNKRERKERFQTRINDYAPGEQALLDVIQMLLNQETPDFEELTRAKLELADWYLLFGDLKRAFLMYRNVLISDVSGDSGSFVQKELSTPKLLYMPYPIEDLPSEEDDYQRQVPATVSFSVTVSRTGKVQNASLVSMNPETLDENRYRTTVEFARFRPAFEEGVPVSKREVPMTYQFNYVPPR